MAIVVVVVSLVLSVPLRSLDCCSYLRKTSEICRRMNILFGKDRL